MSAEQSLEDRLVQLTGQVTDKMLGRQADPLSSVQQIGVGIVRLVSDTEQGGWSSLTLDCKGEWGFKVAMEHSPVGPDLEDILRVYSYIVDPGSRDVLGIDLDDVHEANAAQYIRQNRERLLNGLVGSLETTLQTI